MLSKKILFFAVSLAPFAAHAALPVNCDIIGGRLSCNTGAFVNSGSTILNTATLGSDVPTPMPLTWADLAVLGGTASTSVDIFNVGMLELSLAGGRIDIGGFVYNGWNDADGDGVVDSGEDMNTASLKLDGGVISIGLLTSDPRGVALLNRSISGVYLGRSVSINAADTLYVGGSVWNNTINGSTQEIANATGISLTAANTLRINGDYISFGGSTDIVSGAADTVIVGNLRLAGSSGASLVSAKTQLSIGGLVDLSAGSASFSSDGAFTVGGNFSVSSAGNTDINVGTLSVGGMMSVSAGMTTIKSGGTVSAAGITTGSSSLVSVESSNAGGMRLILGSGGLNVARDLTVGFAATSAKTGDFEITAGASANYEIQSDGNITAAGGMSLASGKNLSINGNTAFVDVSIGGQVSSGGSLYVGQSNSKIRSFLSGNIVNSGNLVVRTGNDSGSANANKGDISVGDIDNGAGAGVELDAYDDLAAGSLRNGAGAGAAKFTAQNGSMTIGGNVSNGSASGDMILQAKNGTIGIGGNLANSGGGKISVANAGAVSITGGASNAIGGKLYFGYDDGAVYANPVASLTINGALSNGGAFRADVVGTTSLGGLTIATGATKFWLKTGTLSIGSNPADRSAALGALLNNSIDLHLELTGADDISVASITNGADMFVFARNIATTNRIQNTGGEMRIEANGGNISIGGGLNNQTTDGISAAPNPSKTELRASGAGTISVSGSVGNFGDLVINGGGGVSLGAVLNNNKMDIRTLLGGTQKLTIAGPLQNIGKSTAFDLVCSGSGCVDAGSGVPVASDLFIAVNQLDVGGVFTNSAGTAFIYFENSVLAPVANNFHGVEVFGGRLDIGGAGGILKVRDGVAVSAGGFLNIMSGLSGIATSNGALSVAGNITSQAGYAAGNLNVGTGTFLVDTGTAAVSVGGGVIFNGNVSNSLGLKTSGDISIAGNAALSGDAAHTLILGGSLTTGPDASANSITVGGALSATGNGANLVVLRGNATVGSVLQSGNGKISSFGDYLRMTGGGTINGGIGYQSVGTGGLMIDTSVSDFELSANGTGADINIVGGIGMDGANTLRISAADEVISSGGAAITNSSAGGTLRITSGGVMRLDNTINNAGTLAIVAAKDLTIGGKLTNSGAASITNSSGNLLMNDIENNGGTLTINNSARMLGAAAIAVSGGKLTMSGAGLIAGSINHTGGQIVWNGGVLDARSGGGTGMISLNGNLSFGTAAAVGADPYAMNITQNAMTLGAKDLRISGGALKNYGNNANIRVDNDFIADAFDVSAGTLDIDVGNRVVISSALTTASAAAVDISGEHIDIAGINNDGELSIDTRGNDASLGMVDNDGVMQVSAWNGSTGGIVKVDGIDNTTGKMTLLNGARLESGGDIDIGSLWQDGANHSSVAGALSIITNDYTISMDAGKSINVAMGVIGRVGNILRMETNELNIADGGIDARNGTIIVSAAKFNDPCPYYNGSCSVLPSSPGYGVASNWTPWLKADITGNVSGGTQFWGVGRMDIHGNYTFDNRSMLSFNVLQDALTDGTYSFKGDIVVDPNGKFVVDLRPGSANPMVPIIEIDGRFITDVSFPSGRENGTDISMVGGNIGVTIFDAILDNSAIWLLHAKEGIDNKSYYPRNLNVYFCNADGTKCFAYLSSGGNLPAYIREDDSDRDGVNDSLFAVFDPKYGGPILIYKIRPKIQPLAPSFNLDSSAGAIDDWVYYGLTGARFNPKNNNPIEAVRLLYDGTIFEDMGNALYDRMEYSNISNDPRPLAEFSSLFIPVEARQLATSIDASERMVQQVVQKRMIDESLWTRNRVKSKAWIDVDYGFQSIKNPDGDNPIKGDRMSVQAGYDVQINPNTIIGFNAGLTNISNAEKQEIDVSFSGSSDSVGRRETSLKDMGLNVGAYLISRITDSAQAYVSANMHSHAASVERKQTYIADIKGDGKASSITGELGLIHSLSAQYVVGNLSARLAYGNGLSLTEKVGGSGYMNFKQDGYTTLAPGYSILFQKRVYLKPTFIMRPYLSLGAEYEITGMGDIVKYKFAPSETWSDFKLERDPLWMTGKVGLEFLTISGLQFGAGYEYHHNAAIQTHDIHINFSMRF